MTIFNKKIFLYTLLFLTFLIFTFYYFSFFSLGTIEDNDSHTYFYLLDNNYENYKLFSSKRPPVFPAYLLLLSKISSDYSGLYLILNYLFRSLSVFIVAWVIFLITKNKPLSLIGFFISVFNVLLLQHINYLNPEILLNFILMIHIIITWKLFNKPKLNNIILLFISFFCLTFTKPIFLFYPIFYLLLFSIFYFSKIFTTKFIKEKLIIIFFFFFIYLLPIYLWSTHNLQNNNYFSFSVISDINLTGKIMQYNLVKNGPNELLYQPLKLALTKKGEYKDIYYRLSLIFDATPKGENPYIFIGEFSKKTIQNNIQKYLFFSFKEIPRVLQSIPQLSNDFYYFNKLDGLLNNFFIVTYLNIWSNISKYYWVLLIIIFTGFSIYSYQIINKSLFKNKKNIMIYFIALIWFYVNLIVALAAYDGYSRLRSIVDDIYIIILIFSLNIFYKFILKKYYSK